MASVIEAPAEPNSTVDATALPSVSTQQTDRPLPTDSAANAIHQQATVSNGNKKRRIRFSIAWDILLLKAVTAVDAHLAPHGEAQNRFEEALALFRESLPRGSFDNICLPTWKTLNDRFKKILSDHRDAVKNNTTASGIIEVRGERETLLDDVVLEVDEWEEAKRAERDERTELDKRLRQAGEDIRTRALNRGRPESVTNTDAPPKQEPRKRPLSSDSDAEDQGRLEHIEAKKEVEEKRLKIEERRLDFEMGRESREAARLDRAQDNESRRIAIDEKRIELEERRLALEKEERKGAIGERKEVLAVLGALVKKLQ